MPEHRAFRPHSRLVALLTRPLVEPPEGLESLRTRLLVLGFWMFLAVLETAKEWVSFNLRGAPRPWSSVALVNVPFWLYWALVTPGIVALARRVPLSGPRRVRAVAVHVAASLVVALGHLATVAFVAVQTLGRAGELGVPTFTGQLRPLVEGYLVLELFIYWMVLGAYHALLYHHRYLQGRVREAEAHTRAARSEAGAAEARLQALRMELDPHFLFNALNAVSGLVRTGDRDGAVTMLARLGELLRVTLRYGRGGSVSLGREVELVRRYLELEEVRFGDRLRVEIELDPRVVRARVPPLILQPLVENAVRHGVAPTRGAVTLTLRARPVGDDVEVEIRDTGRGMDPAASEGTGLANVRARLREELGPAANLALEPAAGGGTVARVRMPWREPESGRGTREAVERDERTEPAAMETT